MTNLIPKDEEALSRSPQIEQQVVFSNYWEYRVNFVIKKPTISDDKFPNCGSGEITILKCVVPKILHRITLPSFEVFFWDSLWNESLLEAVIKALKESRQAAFGYIADSLPSFGLPKELRLPNNSILIGRLKSTNPYFGKMEISGFIRTPDGITSEQTLFSIENLDECCSIYLTRAPFCKKNKSIWCKELEKLVIEHLKVLVKFCDKNLAKKLSTITARLEKNTIWIERVRRLDEALRRLNPEQRKNPRGLESDRGARTSMPKGMHLIIVYIPQRAQPALLFFNAEIYYLCYNKLDF